VSAADRWQVAWRMTFDVIGADAAECMVAAGRMVDQFFARSERAVILELDVSPLVVEGSGAVVRWKAECQAITIEGKHR